jgi:hypothetical protein
MPRRGAARGARAAVAAGHATSWRRRGRVAYFNLYDVYRPLVYEPYSSIAPFPPGAGQDEQR